MRYFTEEWCRRFDACSVCEGVRASKKALAFDETFFRSLYAKKEREWVDLQRSVSEISFDEIYPEYYDPTLYLSPGSADGFTPMSAEEYREMRDAARIAYDEAHEPFDPAASRELFFEVYSENLRVLGRLLPERILSEVADIRVLALDVASPEVKSELVRYSRECGIITQKAIREYGKCREKLDLRDTETEQALYACGARVTSCRKRGADIVLSLDTSQSASELSRIVFRSVDGVRLERRLYGTLWRNHELYREAGKYEFCAIFEDSHGEYRDFSLKCKDIILETEE